MLHHTIVKTQATKANGFRKLTDQELAAVSGNGDIFGNPDIVVTGGPGGSSFGGGGGGFGRGDGIENPGAGDIHVSIAEGGGGGAQVPAPSEEEVDVVVEVENQGDGDFELSAEVQGFEFIAGIEDFDLTSFTLNADIGGGQTLTTTVNLQDLGAELGLTVPFNVNGFVGEITTALVSDGTFENVIVQVAVSAEF